MTPEYRRSGSVFRDQMSIKFKSSQNKVQKKNPAFLSFFFPAESSCGWNSLQSHHNIIFVTSNFFDLPPRPANANCSLREFSVFSQFTFCVLLHFFFY